MARNLASAILFVSLIITMASPVHAQQTVTRNPRLYPEQVRKIAGLNNPYRCDHIAWSLAPREEPDEVMTLACSDWGALYATACGNFAPLNPGDMLFDIYGPSPNHVWVACAVLVTNVGDDDLMVSPTDFTLIDAKGYRYQPDMTATLLDPDTAFPFDPNVGQGQSVGGLVVFEVPKVDTNKPYRLEVEAPLFSDAEDVVIIIDPHINDLLDMR